MRIGVVLDASAVLAYARMDAIAVGELISSAYEGDARTGIPVLVLLDVCRELSPKEWDLVTELTSREDGPVAVIGLAAHQVPGVAVNMDGLDYAAAQTVAAVRDLGATLATYTPSAYTAYLDDYDVLALS
ncbi:hypothetical protein [Catellatospora methionotrophica]|uniref:hypothetical protein n=1 Tax=Catellatospora methionotrophica TaxID=121620 RepID=UPI0033E42E61